MKLYTVYKHTSPSGKVYIGITSKKPEHPASKVVYQYDLLGNFIKKWDCISDVQRCLNIIVTHITACCNGRQKTAGGYIWKRQFDAKMKLERDKLAEEKIKREEEMSIKRQSLKHKNKQQ